VGRPSRSWVRKTYTVSSEVEKAIAIQAAEQGIDPGTVVDFLFWNTFLKPDVEQLKNGNFTEDELERIFAEEVLAHLDGEGGIEKFAVFMCMHDNENTNLRKVRGLVGRWRRTRHIDKGYQEELLNAFGDGFWLPSILKHGQVELDWFQSE